MKREIIRSLLFASAVLIAFAGCSRSSVIQNDPENFVRLGDDTYLIKKVVRSFDSMLRLQFIVEGGAEAVFGIYPESGASLTTGQYVFAGESSQDHGNPGTTAEGAFKFTEVVSGVLNVSVSGTDYEINADCMCVDGKRLTVKYKGEIERDGPTGIFIEYDGFYSKVYVEMRCLGKVTDDLNATEFIIESDDVYTYFKITPLFFHSAETLPSGIYMVASNDDMSASGSLECEIEGTPVNGPMNAGKIVVAVSEDIYTIEFDEVYVYSEEYQIIIDLSGKYIGTVVSGDL